MLIIWKIGKEQNYS